MLGWFILDTQSASRHLFIEAFLIGRSPHCERFLFATFEFFALDSSKLKKKTKTFGYRNFIHVDHIEPDMLRICKMLRRPSGIAGRRER